MVLVQEEDQWQAFMNTVMNPWVRLEAENLVISFPTAPLIISQGLFNSAVPTAGYFIVH